MLGQAVCVALSPYVSCQPSLDVRTSYLFSILVKKVEVVECVHLVMSLVVF